MAQELRLSPVRRLVNSKRRARFLSGISRLRASDFFGLWIHDEVIIAAQIDAGVQLDRPRLKVPQPKVSGDGHEMNLHFDTGKMLPDAIPRAGGKRHRRQSMSVFGIFSSKAVWIEAVRLLPKIGVPLEAVQGNVDFASSRNEILPELIVMHCSAA